MARRTSSRSAQLSRELIVTTALRLVDAGGWDALTMRGLAEALGVYPTAVHWYVGPKANLANLIAKRAFDELSREPGDADGNWSSDFEQALTRLNGLAYPALTRNMPDLMNRTFLLRWESGKERPLDDGFELALTSLLDGLRRAMPSGGGND